MRRKRGAGDRHPEGARCRAVDSGDFCRNTGVSGAFYKRSKYGGLEVSDAGKLKALEEENCKAEEAPGGVDADIKIITRSCSASTTKSG